MGENKCIFVNSKGITKSCCQVKKNIYKHHSNEDGYILENLRYGDSLYVCNSNITVFASSMLQNLKVKVVLVTGDDDECIPFTCQEATRLILNSDKIVHWFAQNCTLSHPKITNMPIGLDYHTIFNNKDHSWGKNQTPVDQEKEILELYKNSKQFYERQVRIYSTFHFALSRGDRQEAFNEIPKDLIDYEANQVDRMTTHKKQLEYAFVASPFGRGLDCHRTWEAIALGCIPIIKSSGMDPLFEGLPVLVVKKWSDVTQELLEETVKRFREESVKFSLDNSKMHLKYWVDKFESYRKDCFTSETSIVIAGTCKNVSKYFNKTKENIMKVARRFKSYKIVIVENDSTDNTRELLREWQSQDKNVRVVVFDKLYTDKVKHRTEVLAYCRNVCIQEIKTLDTKEYPYTLMVDMDDVLQSDKFSFNGVYSCIQEMEKDSTLGALGAVVDGPYYDIFALRNKECNYNCWEMVFKHKDELTWDGAVEKYVNSHKKNYSSSEVSTIEVESMFGGASVYRNDVWLKVKYSGTTSDGKEVCEHVPMNAMIKSLGYKVALNPSFVIY
jgi:hypothetical protein